MLNLLVCNPQYNCILVDIGLTLTVAALDKVKLLTELEVVRLVQSLQQNQCIFVLYCVQIIVWAFMLTVIDVLPT